MTGRISEGTRERIAKAWPELMDTLANGQLVHVALAAAGISRDQMRAYKAGNPQACKEWDMAREDSADAFMDDALATANNPALDPAHARVKVDTLKWAARIRNPRLYGDKAQLDVNVRTVDLTRIIQDANARLAAAQAGRIIDAQVIPAQLENLL